MMPENLGGVVDSTLKVYGTSNLRVVDTSLFPIIPGGHLQSVAYAVAERVVEIIRTDNNGGASGLVKM
jgi:choline dehydrogenase-like flavoprotein